MGPVANERGARVHAISKKGNGTRTPPLRLAAAGPFGRSRRSHDEKCAGPEKKIFFHIKRTNFFGQFLSLTTTRNLLGKHFTALLKAKKSKFFFND